MWASLGMTVKNIGKLRKNPLMKDRYRTINSLDFDTLFPDAWEITVNIKDLTPNNFNTYIHHFIHGFESNVQILQNVVTKDKWVTAAKSADQDALRKQLSDARAAALKTQEQNNLLFVQGQQLETLVKQAMHKDTGGKSTARARNAAEEKHVEQVRADQNAVIAAQRKVANINQEITSAVASGADSKKIKELEKQRDAELKKLAEAQEQLTGNAKKQAEADAVRNGFVPGTPEYDAYVDANTKILSGQKTDEQLRIEETINKTLTQEQIKQAAEEIASGQKAHLYYYTQAQIGQKVDDNYKFVTAKGFNIDETDKYASDLDFIKNEIVYGHGDSANNMRTNWAKLTAEEQAEVIQILHDGGNVNILARSDSKNLSTAELMANMRKTPAEAKAKAVTLEAQRQANAAAQRKANTRMSDLGEAASKASMYGDNYGGAWPTG